jgi:hypothetical protein
MQDSNFHGGEERDKTFEALSCSSIHNFDFAAGGWSQVLDVGVADYVYRTEVV